MEITTETNVTNRNGVKVPVSEQGLVIGVYSVLLVIGAVGNVGVFTSLLRSRRRKSRVNLLMTHLVIADMIVIFFAIPVEIVWKATNAWLAGNFACKFFSILRAFGLYLSSNVLVCISVDRFFAIIYPLRLLVARERSKMMLYCAWIIAFICSFPQSLVFRVMQHPQEQTFEQCVAFNASESKEPAVVELVYNFFFLCAVYFVPLMVICVCYVCIFYEISKNSRQNSEKHQTSEDSQVMLRRSDQRPLARARRRTLRMTVTIVTVFACCWLPYATMTMWYMIDRESAERVSRLVQDLFFVMAVSNSCMDPLVYGSYAIESGTFTRTLRKIFCIHTKPSKIPDQVNGNVTLNAAVSMLDSENTNKNRRVSRRYPRFEECSSVRPSVNSDPIPLWNGRSSNDAIELVLKQAHSCDVFVLHSPPERTYNVSAL